MDGYLDGSIFDGGDGLYFWHIFKGTDKVAQGVDTSIEEAQQALTLTLAVYKELA
jgi:hypothetical protein